MILTLHKTSLNLSQEGLRLSVSKQNARSEELIADISDTPSFSYSRGELQAELLLVNQTIYAAFTYLRNNIRFPFLDSNDTKKQDDGYIDWAVYVGTGF